MDKQGNYDSVYPKPLEIRWRIYFDSTEKELDTFLNEFYPDCKEEVKDNFKNIDSYLKNQLSSDCFDLYDEDKKFIFDNFHYDKNAKYLDKVMYGRYDDSLKEEHKYKVDYYLEDSSGNTVYLQKGIIQDMAKVDGYDYSYVYSMDIEEACAIQSDRMQTIVDREVFYDFRHPNEYEYDKGGYPYHKGGVQKAEMPYKRLKSKKPVLLTQDMLNER